MSVHDLYPHYVHVCVYHNPVFMSHDLMSLIHFVFLQRHDIVVSSNPEASLILVLRVYEEPRMSLEARKNENKKTVGLGGMLELVSVQRAFQFWSLWSVSTFCLQY